MTVKFIHAAGPPPPHVFGPKHSKPADPAIGEPERIVRTCATCGLSKITIISTTRGPRLYRWGDGIEFEDEREPTCRVGAAKGEAA